jgi:hypothetical protein
MSQSETVKLRNTETEHVQAEIIGLNFNTTDQFDQL